MTPTLLGQDSALPSHDAMGEIWELLLPSTFCVHGTVGTSLIFTLGHFPNPCGETEKKKGTSWSLSGGRKEWGEDLQKEGHGGWEEAGGQEGRAEPPSGFLERYLFP